MSNGCVTLDEVFAAAGVRAASLVPETSGYLALAVGDATSRLPFAIEDRSVMLTTEGNVGLTRRGEMLPPAQASRNLRAMLARLLVVSTGTAMPSLLHASKAREESDRGVDAVVEEIEAALIPVNRAAARRALARLARETIKAKEAGKLKPRASTRPPAEASKPAVEAPKPEVAREAVQVPVEAPKTVQVPVEVPLAAAPQAAPQPAPAPVRAATPVPPRLEMLPPPFEAEPTPTVLGMGAVEIHGPVPEEESEPRTEIEVETAAAVVPEEEPARAPDDEPRTDVGEPAVLMAPSEEPEDAFDLGHRGPPPRTVAEPLTPPFALEAEPAPRELPGARAVACEPTPRELPSAPAHVHTRADDLLAHFGASCVDDASLRAAAACLRQIAGIDPTAPPARVEIRVAPPPSRSDAYEALAQIPQDAETPIVPRVRARRGWSLPSVGLTLFVLVAGLAGGGALVRLRPELFGVGSHTLPLTAPAPVATPEPAPAPVPVEAPSTSAQPAGARSPSSTERLGGTRAERGTTERAR